MLLRQKLNPNWNTCSDIILLQFAKTEASKRMKCQFEIETFLSHTVGLKQVP